MDLNDQILNDFFNNSLEKNSSTKNGNSKLTTKNVKVNDNINKTLEIEEFLSRVDESEVKKQNLNIKNFEKKEEKKAIKKNNVSVFSSMLILIVSALILFILY